MAFFKRTPYARNSISFQGFFFVLSVLMVLNVLFKSNNIFLTYPRLLFVTALPWSVAERYGQRIGWSNLDRQSEFLMQSICLNLVFSFLVFSQWQIRLSCFFSVFVCLSGFFFITTPTRKRTFVKSKKSYTSKI